MKWRTSKFIIYFLSIQNMYSPLGENISFHEIFTKILLNLISLCVDMFQMLASPCKIKSTHGFKDTYSVKFFNCKCILKHFIAHHYFVSKFLPSRNHVIVLTFCCLLNELLILLVTVYLYFVHCLEMLFSCFAFKNMN